MDNYDGDRRSGEETEAETYLGRRRRGATPYRATIPKEFAQGGMISPKLEDNESIVTVDMQLDCLSNAIDQVNGAADRLINRISAILTPEMTEQSNPNMLARESDSSPSSPVVAGLQERIDWLDRITGDLHRATRRVELS